MHITAKALETYYREQGLADYAIHDVDDTDEVYPKYWGSVHYSGAFIIMRQSDESTYRFYRDYDSYKTSWIARATLDYEYIFELGLDS